MAKRSQIQIALDKINSEIEDLMRVRQRLFEALEVKDAKPKAPRKLKAREAKPDSAA